MQISVVVAAIQTSYSFESISIVDSDSEALKAVVGKVSLRVALMQRLVGPKRQEKSS